ncbi:hypothetical protein Syun_019749 [Stephania yunnanensis]|uniref:Uncharacterized protein n=1 Tax=Stephania yunnanensis TaxID=152371 RepID=A0AAP0IWN6_9MAGN
MGVGSPATDPFWTLCKIGETGRTSGDDEQVLPTPRPQLQPHQMLQQVDNVELVPRSHFGKSFGGKDYQSSNNVPSQQQRSSDNNNQCDDDGDQGWIDDLESTLEVDDEEQQPQVHKIDDQQLLMGPHHDQQVDDQQRQQQQLQQSECNNDGDPDRLVLMENDLPPEFWVNLHELQQLPLIHQPLFEQHQPQVLQQQADDNIITVEDCDDISPCICLDEYQGCFNSWMETIKKGGHDDQQQQFDDEKEEDDQDWIENLESTLEVDDEEQQPLQQLPLIHQPLFEQHQPQVLQQHTDDNIINVEDYDDIPPCIFLDEYQDNFNSWMETIKKRGHDDQQKQVDEEEEPSPKRAKARVAN